MIYPKFSQKQLAVVVVCLLLTLGAVGVSFLIYFFNEPLLLNTVYATQQPQQQQRAVLNKEYTSSSARDRNDDVPGVEFNATVDSFEMLNATNSKFGALTQTPAGGADFEEDNQIEADEVQKQVDEQQNIYIDELDRPSLQVAASGGGFFASSKASKIEMNRLVKPRLTKATAVKKAPNLDQIYDNVNMATANDDDDDDSAFGDGREEGSGSGYFDSRKFVGVGAGVAGGVYDDETNNFINRISLKMLQSQHGRALKLSRQRIMASLRPKRLKAQRKANKEASPRRILPDRVDVQAKVNYRRAHNPSTSGPLAVDSRRDWDTRTPMMNNRQPQQLSLMSMSPAWLETRTRRIIGNVKKSEERSRQLLLCEKEEAGGGELCRMLFKGHLND